ncbi:MAG TPA: hypothetical protein VGH38_05455 [Bryobacteraceae bacterium]|jgi:hypothetical protein
MYVKTGPGKAGTYPDPAFYDFLLYNFDIEGSELKLQHKRYLDIYIVPKVRDGWTFLVQGTSSQTGTGSYDLWLSRRRSKAVQNYVEGVLKRTLPNLITEGIGKDVPIGKGQESELDRAVRLYGWAENFRPKPPKPRPQVKPTPLPEIGPPIQPDIDGTSIEFFIRMTGGISVGPRIVQGEWQRFMIWDKIHGKAAKFTRLAGGAGIPVPLPGSFTQEGEDNRILLSKPLPPMRLIDFDQAGTVFTSRGTADLGKSALTIRPTGLKDAGFIEIDPFKTGFSWGFSFQNGSAGILQMDKDTGIFDRKA